ncbi:hypothetical protein NDN08_003980 [Rhodosorus marinus]|uniref:Uncharacterized protein n=1 Tax=Rhodosorus marinus TaxID=101924 RepID=A0AAV8UH06_9RHOD|nr:hypothetical protein NDN08_003980 [Rhodosorus marinus]
MLDELRSRRRKFSSQTGLTGLPSRGTMESRDEDQKKSLRDFIRSSREYVSGGWNRVKSTVGAPVERAEEFWNTGSAHLDAEITRLVKLRHQSNPLLSMSIVALLVGLPSIKLAGPGPASRYALITFAATGLLFYPDYVTQHVLEYSSESKRE